MIKEYLEALQSGDREVNRLFTFLGVEVVAIDPEECVLGLVVQAEFLQGAGVMPGGLSATLLDEAMAHVVMAGLGNGQSTVTVELSVRFLAPVKEGERVTARARVVKRGGRVVTVEAELNKEDGSLAAKSMGSFLVCGRG